MPTTAITLSKPTVSIPDAASEADGDAFHDILHEHQWTSELGYGYLPSASSAPESDTSSEGTSQSIMRVLNGLASDASGVKSDAFYMELILKRCQALSSDAAVVAALTPLVLNSQSPSHSQAHGHGNGVIVPTVDYSLTWPDADRRHETLLSAVQTPVSRVFIAVALHLVRRTLITAFGSVNPDAAATLIGHITRGLYVNADSVHKRLSASGCDPADIGALYTHGLPAMSAWLSDHQEAKRLAHRLMCVRQHDVALTARFKATSSRRIQSVWRLAFRLILQQVVRAVWELRSCYLMLVMHGLTRIWALIF